jgi:hypothetical protein
MPNAVDLSFEHDRGLICDRFELAPGREAPNVER